MTKRFLSMVLALSMLLSLMPVSAFADTGGGISFAPSDTAELEEQNDATETTGTGIGPGKDLYIGDDGKPTTASGKHWKYENDTLTLDSTSENTTFNFGGANITAGKLVFDTLAYDLVVQNCTFTSSDNTITLEIAHSSNITLHGITFAGNVTWNADTNFLYLNGGDGGVAILGDLSFSSYDSEPQINLTLQNTCITGTLKFPRIIYNVTFDSDAPSSVHTISPLGNESDNWLAENFIHSASQLTTTNGNCKITATYAAGITATFDADTNGTNSAWVTAGTTVTLTGDDTCDGWQLQSDAEITGQKFVDAKNTTFTMPRSSVTATAYDALVLGKDETPTKSGGNGWTYENDTLTIEEGHTFNFGVENYAYTGDLSKYHVVSYDAKNSQQIIHRCSIENNGTIVGMVMYGNDSIGPDPSIKLTNTGLITDSSFIGLIGANIINSGKITQSQFSFSVRDAEYGLPAMTGISDSVFFLNEEADSELPNPEMDKTLKDLGCKKLSFGASNNLGRVYGTEIGHDYAYFYGNYDPVTNKKETLRIYVSFLFNVEGQSIDSYPGLFEPDAASADKYYYFLMKCPTEDLRLNVPQSLTIGTSQHVPTATSGLNWHYDSAVGENGTLYLERGAFDLSKNPYIGCDVVVSESAYIAGGMFKGRVTAADAGTYSITGGVFANKLEGMSDVASAHCTKVEIALPSCNHSTLGAYGNSYGPDEFSTTVYVYGETMIRLHDGDYCYYATVTKGDSKEALTLGDLTAIDWVEKSDVGIWNFAPGKAQNIDALTFTGTKYRTDLSIGTDGKPDVDSTYYHDEHFDHPGYHGDGWFYDPTAENGKGLLTITDAVTATGYGDALACRVVFSGANARLSGIPVLLKQPTYENGAVPYLYHLSRGDKGTFGYKNYGYDSLHDLWVPAGLELGLQLGSDSNNTNICNINGKSLSAYQAAFDGESSQYGRRFNFTMPAENVVLNQTIDLIIDETGYPAGSNGGKDSVGGTTANGGVWHFDSDSTTLYLDSGSFDFGPAPVKSSDDILSIDVSANAEIKDGFFAACIVKSASSKISGIFRSTTTPAGITPTRLGISVGNTTLNGYSTNGLDGTAYIYGSHRITIADDRYDPDKNYLQFYYCTEAGGTKHPIDPSKYGWTENANGSVTLNTDSIPDPCYVIGYEIKEYETALVIQYKMPKVDDTYKNDGTTYEGGGWSYNTVTKTLTITGDVTATWDSFPDSKVPALECKVVFSGTGAALQNVVALVEQPTCENGAVSRFYQVSRADGGTFGYDTYGYSSLHDLWVLAGQDLSLHFDPDENLTFTNLNGNSMETYNATIRLGDPYGTLLHFTMPAEDVVINKAVPAEIVDGFPAGSNGGTQSVGGDGWQYIVSSDGEHGTLTITDTVELAGTDEEDVLLSNDITVVVADGGTLTGGYIYGSVIVEDGGTVADLHVFTAYGEDAGATVKNGGTIKGGSFSGRIAVEEGGTISGGDFYTFDEHPLTNAGTIEGGTFHSAVENTGSITGGTFREDVTNNNIISGGTFEYAVTGTGTISGGVFARENLITCTIAENLPVSTVQYLNGQDFTANGVEVYGTLHVYGVRWVAFASDVPVVNAYYKRTDGTEVWTRFDEPFSSGTLPIGMDEDGGLISTYILNLNEYTLKFDADTHAVTFADGSSDGITVTYYDASGAEVTDITQPGTYTVKASVVGTRQYMPLNDQSWVFTVEEEKPDPDPDPDPTPDPDPDPDPTPDPDPDPDPTPDPDPDPNPTPDPDPDPNPTPDPDPDPDPTPDPTPSGGGDGGAVVAVAAVGGAALGVGAYFAGTTAYLRSVLPEGMAIPANREQLAVALWTAAGKPAAQSTALFSDVPAESESLQAIRWAVERGLLTADNNTFNPGRHVTRVEVIRTWNSFRQSGT